jgi:hypothetical protein
MVPTVSVLIVKGVHLPVIPLTDVEGRAGGIEPRHRGPIDSNTGVIEDETSIISLMVEAHCPSDGLNSYVVVPTDDVLMIAGIHVPMMPFVDVKGRSGGAEPWQSGPIGLKIGVNELVIVTLILVSIAH